MNMIFIIQTFLLYLISLSGILILLHELERTEQEELSAGQQIIGTSQGKNISGRFIDYWDLPILNTNWNLWIADRREIGHLFGVLFKKYSTPPLPARLSPLGNPVKWKYFDEESNYCPLYGGAITRCTSREWRTSATIYRIGRESTHSR